MNHRRDSDRRGATLVEYALALALLAAASIGFAALIGPSLASMYQQVIDAMFP